MPSGSFMIGLFEFRILDEGLAMFTPIFGLSIVSVAVH